MEDLKQEIIAYSKTIGIDQIGFASADPFIELKEQLRMQEKLGYMSGFEKGTNEERTEPSMHLEGAKSIIAIAIAYPSRIIDPPKSTRENRRGIFCRASWGEDYHHVLRRKLHLLADFIAEKIPAFRYNMMVDTGELSDRAVAERAGIGFSGKNTLLITEKFGSWVYLGEMITNLPLPPDSPVADSCGDCRICVDACPTGALVDGRLNSQVCLAYQTQTKDFLKEEFRDVLGTRIYGCDTCQAVCPRNKGIDFHLHEALEPEGEIAKPKLKPMLTISNRAFKEQFGHIAGSWRGKKPLQRNAIIGLAHYKDKTAVDDLIQVMQEDVRPVIRGTAAWALGKINDQRALTALKQQLAKETDEQVKYELENSIEKLSES